MTIDEEVPPSLANNGPTSRYSKRFGAFVTITPTEDSSSSFIVRADREASGRNVETDWTRFVGPTASLGSTHAPPLEREFPFGENLSLGGHCTKCEHFWRLHVQ